jgi:hypothetical protein
MTFAVALDHDKARASLDGVGRDDEAFGRLGVEVPCDVFDAGLNGV